MPNSGTLGKYPESHRPDWPGAAEEFLGAVQRRTIKHSERDEYVAAGWTAKAIRKRSLTVERPKAHSEHLEDRVWTLLHRMGFATMSGQGGAILTINPDSDRRLTSQIDVVAIDDEVCVAVECKSLASRGRRPNLQQELAKHSLTREALAKAVQQAEGAKRTVVLALWTQNAVLSETTASGRRNRTSLSSTATISTTTRLSRTISALPHDISS